MKIIALFIVGLVGLIPTLNLAETCPDPGKIVISDDYKITIPAGFRLFSIDRDISQTHPIVVKDPVAVSQDVVWPPASRGPYNNITINSIFCTYCIGSECSGGQFRLVTTPDPFTGDLDSSWEAGRNQLYCTGSCAWFRKK